MLLHRSGEHYPIVFFPLSPYDVKQMRKQKGWSLNFNWSVYFKYPSVEIYKLLVDGSDRIEGLLALEPMEDHAWVHLIESAPHNRGGNREFYGVGGHLLAFACKKSQEFGYDGFIVFQAKTNLIDHYENTYGATLIDRYGRMYIDDVAADRLIRLYLE